MHKTGKSLYTIVLERKLYTEKELVELLSPEAVHRLGDVHSIQRNTPHV
jgi:aspartate ammonia-lyase